MSGQVTRGEFDSFMSEMRAFMGEVREWMADLKPLLLSRSGDLERIKRLEDELADHDEVIGKLQRTVNRLLWGGSAVAALIALFSRYPAIARLFSESGGP